MSQTTNQSTNIPKPVSSVPVVDPTKAQNSKVLTPPPFQVRPLRSDTRYIKVMVYGVPGSGKTYLAGTAVDVPEMQDVIFVSAESGTLTVESAEAIQNRAYVDEIPVNNFKQVGYIQEFLKAHCIARDANNITTLKALQARVFGYPSSIIDEECEDDEYTIGDDGLPVYTRVRLRRYRTVIVDSLSEVNSYLIYSLLGITMDTKFDDKAAEETAGWDEYKKGNQMLQMVIRAYRDLPMHVILVCGTQYTQDHQKVMRWSPSLIGKLGQQVQGFVDVAGYLVAMKPTEEQAAKGAVPRRLWIQPIGAFDAKHRMSSFKDAYFDNPTMQMIMDAFRGTRKTMKAPTAQNQAPKK